MTTPNFAGAITRTLRKHYGINQSDFAKSIDVSQSCLSKIEANLLEMSAIQWVQICELYQIDPRSLFKGKIEILGSDNKKNFQADQYSSIGKFKMPIRFSKNLTSTVRSAFPLILFAIKKMGIEKCNELISYLGVDPDYFVVQSHPLSLKFIEEFVLNLKSRSHLDLNKPQEILSEVPLHDIHGHVLSTCTGRPLNRFNQFVTKINQYYEVNSQYEIKEENEIYIQVRDSYLIQHLKLSEEFQQFRMNYNLAHLNTIYHSLQTKQPSQLNVRKIDHGWDIYSVAS